MQDPAILLSLIVWITLTYNLETSRDNDTKTW